MKYVKTGILSVAGILLIDHFWTLTGWPLFLRAAIWGILCGLIPFKNGPVFSRTITVTPGPDHRVGMYFTKTWDLLIEVRIFGLRIRKRKYRSTTLSGVGYLLGNHRGFKVVFPDPDPPGL